MVDNAGAPVFFLSYARAKQTKRQVSPPTEENKCVQRLFVDLSANINELIVLPPGQDPGFMDVTMGGGQRWESRLKAAGSCQVFICLLSAPYLSRRWCAMEWDVFSRRRILPKVDSVPDDETGILPVLWAPVHREIPAVVARVNRFRPTGLPDDSILSLYERHGLFGLRRLGRKDAYHAVVWKLALQVQQLYHSYRVEPLFLPDTAGLRRSFSRSTR